MSLFLNRKLFFFIFIFALFKVSFAQEPATVEKSNNKVILEGKIYYIHMVKPGQTLYSIAKAYHVSQKQIAIENPGVMSGLQIGQALKIPLKTTMDEQIDTSPGQKPAYDEEGFAYYKVKRRETLYSIARFYNVAVEQIRTANPELGWGGPKTYMTRCLNVLLHFPK